MKLRIPLVLLALFLAPAAVAQETYNFSLGGAFVTQLDKGRVLGNYAICRSLLLPKTCTQAEACVVEPQVTGGAACTATDALAAGRRIQPNTLAGRQSFLANTLVRAQLPNYDAAWAQEELTDFKAFCAASQANKDAICTAASLPAGCGVCGLIQ